MSDHATYQEWIKIRYLAGRDFLGLAAGSCALTIRNAATLLFNLFVFVFFRVQCGKHPTKAVCGKHDEYDFRRILPRRS